MLKRRREARDTDWLPALTPGLQRGVERSRSTATLILDVTKQLGEAAGEQWP